MAADTPARVGFIGLGRMGAPMSLRLARAGHALTVWNRDPAKAEAVVGAGAALADDPKAVARASDIVFTCVFDADAVGAILFGENGLAVAGRDGLIVVDHSTIPPAAARAFSARLKREAASAFIDAPVTGGVAGATDGSLTIFAGGDRDAAETVRPVAAAMSRRFEYLGESGAGQTAKMCNQVMVMATMVTMAEMFKLAEGGGVEAARLADLFAGGFADSRVLQMFGEAMATRSDAVTGQMTTLTKDLGLIGDVARAQGTALPMAGLALQLGRMAVAAGHGERDVSQIIRLYDR